MGQKTNPISLQIGNKIGWDTKFAEKKKRDTGVVALNDELTRTFINRFLKSKGLQLHQIKIYYLDDTIKIYLSIFAELEERSQNKQKKIIVKSLTSTNCFSFLKKPQAGALVSLTRLLNEFFRTSGKKSQVFISFANNYLNIKDIEKKNLKKKILTLRRFRKRDFFLSGLEKSVATAKNKTFSAVLANFIIEHVSTTRKVNIVVKFLKKVFTLLIEDPYYPISGVKIILKGRLSRAGRARTRLLVLGQVPCNTLNTVVSYNSGNAYTKNGSLGVRLWIV